MTQCVDHPEGGKIHDYVYCECDLAKERQRATSIEAASNILVECARNEASDLRTALGKSNLEKLAAETACEMLKAKLAKAVEALDKIRHTRAGTETAEIMANIATEALNLKLED